MTMTSPSGYMLATLSQGDRRGDLTARVKDLPTSQFRDLLDQITNEFQQFLRAIDMINNEALETMLEQILEAFTLKIGQILQADRTTIFLVDEEKEQLWSKIAQGENGRFIELRVPLNVGIAGHVAATGECLNIPDAYSHPLFNREIDQQTGYHTRNILCMPIFSMKNRVVAVVQLLNKRTGKPFDQDDEEEFRQFAESIGIILESCNSFYVAARNQRGVAALLKATSCLGQSLDLEKTLRAVMDEARTLMQADRSTLFLLDREQKELWSKVAKADGQTMMEIRIPADRGIAGYVASTGQTLNIPHAYEDPRFDPTTDQRTGYHTRNLLCMPVYNSAGTLIGVTQLINKPQGSFTSSDEEFMRAFNIQAGIALENAQLFESVLLEKQYQKDMLQSLSDAVISTDMQGRIVTINDAALELLGCPIKQENGRQQQQIWLQKIIGRYVWDIIPIEKLQMRLEDSLETGSKHYVPEQSLNFGIYEIPAHAADMAVERTAAERNPANLPMYVLAIRDRQNPDQYLIWNEKHPSEAEGVVSDLHQKVRSGSTSASQVGFNGRSTLSSTGTTRTASPMPFMPFSQPSSLPASNVREIERSINLTVNPLTNPEGGVRGGLIVLEDISREKRMKATMHRYMTPKVAERALEMGEDALMEGERRDVTILFSDIRSYTSLTEKMGAADVVSLLNNYFETMVEAVFNFEGTLDKFIGDALMAVFGAPLPLTDNHAWMAVQSALDMRRRLKEFNRDRGTAKKPTIRIGIGLSSGEVVSGNIGSQKRMDYTVIGDGVDISARLEGVTKEYGCDIILSEYTYKLCGDRIWTRELDRIRVKGKTKPISIYELVGDRQHALADQTQEFLDLYAAGREAYQSMNFHQAIRLFEKAQRLQEDDRAIEVHLERAQGYLQNPPPEEWDGVYTMMTK
jgi:adenylate cyclase